MNLHPVMNPHAPGRPPTLALLLGLLITLATVVAYSWYVSAQITGLRQLQTDLTDRNRRDSLQLLRIQNDLNQLALAMRDMLDASEPLSADRLVGAVRPHPAGSRRRPRRRRRAWLSPGGPRSSAQVPGQLASRSSGTPPIASSRSPRAGHDGRGASPDPGVAAGATGGAQRRRWRGCWWRTTKIEEQTAQQVQDIYAVVQRQVYWFLAATLVAIALTSLFLIRSNRRLFAAARGAVGRSAASSRRS